MKNNIIIIILTILVLGLTGYIVYDKVLSTEEENTNYQDNDNQNYNSETEIDSNIYKDIIGTYYNSDYNQLYFSLKENGKLDMVVSSCGEGPLPMMEGTYKIVRQIYNSIILEMTTEGNNSNTYTYIGFTTPLGHYKFIPTRYGCAEDQNTYFTTKSYE